MCRQIREGKEARTTVARECHCPDACALDPFGTRLQSQKVAMRLNSLLFCTLLSSQCREEERNSELAIAVAGDSTPFVGGGLTSYDVCSQRPRDDRQRRQSELAGARLAADRSERMDCPASVALAAVEHIVCLPLTSIECIGRQKKALQVRACGSTTLIAEFLSLPCACTFSYSGRLCHSNLAALVCLFNVQRRRCLLATSRYLGHHHHQPQHLRLEA